MDEDDETVDADSDDDGLPTNQAQNRRRQSLPAILQHRRDSLLAGHPHQSHRRRSIMMQPVRGYFHGGQIWVLITVLANIITIPLFK